MSLLPTIAVVMLFGTLAASPLAAQWIRHPTAGLPRKADGSVDMSAPAPRTADGKPDFSGLWTSDEIDPRRPKSVVTEGAKVREEIRRPDLGHLEIQVTVDDPKAYTKPWTVLIKERLIVDTELIDEVCLENERSLQHMQ